MTSSDTAEQAPNAPADRLRQAAEVVRADVARAGSQPWAPDAVAAFGPALAAWLESVASELDKSVPPDQQETVEPKAFATADAILAAVSR